MSPLIHLYSLAALTLAAYLISQFDRRRHGRVLKRVAGELDMNYSASDPFGLAAKIVDRFPVPGAAQLRVSDILYGLKGDRYRYIFTAHFTIGAVRSKKRTSRVTIYVERAAGAAAGGALQGAGEVRVASPAMSWADQYRALGRGS